MSCFPVRQPLKSELQAQIILYLLYNEVQYLKTTIILKAKNKNTVTSTSSRMQDVLLSRSGKVVTTDCTPAVRGNKWTKTFIPPQDTEPHSQDAWGCTASQQQMSDGCVTSSVMIGNWQADSNRKPTGYTRWNLCKHRLHLNWTNTFTPGLSALRFQANMSAELETFSYMKKIVNRKVILKTSEVRNKPWGC